VNPPLRLLVAFNRTLQQPPDVLTHVDGREMWLAGVWGYHGRWQVYAPDLDAQVILTARSVRQMQNAAGRTLPTWARPLAATCHALATMGRLPAAGARVMLAGDEPPGARYDFSMALVFAAACCEAYGEMSDTAALIDLVERALRK